MGIPDNHVMPLQHLPLQLATVLSNFDGEQDIGSSVSTAAPSADFGIRLEELTSMTKDNNLVALKQYGGVKGLEAKLMTNLDTGVPGDDADIAKRKTIFGSNTYPIKKGKGFLFFLWQSFQDLTLIILIIAAVVSLALGIKTEGLKEGWYDGGSIVFAVLIVIFVTATTDYQQSLQFQKLSDEKRNICLEVIRGGISQMISIYDVVVGDVVPLKIGDQVPADGIFITGHSLSIDESNMTGESKLCHKDKKSPFLLAGCKVADGFGNMMVTSVGTNTEWGLLTASISEHTGQETPLQVRLNGVATFIGVIGLSVGLSVLSILLIRLFTGNTKDRNGHVQFIHGQTGISEAIDGVIEVVAIAVTIVVVGVPERLPLAVILTLSYSMRKIMADKALVRRLSGCEAMGCATTICSNKTGILTLNQMTVIKAYAGKKRLYPPSDSSQIPKEHSTLIIEGVAVNTTGGVYLTKDGGPAEVSGSPTEKAILSWGVELGMNFDGVRSEAKILHVSPFNSEKKRGGVALQLPNSDVHIHWKGAAEMVLASCTQFLDADGSVKPIDDEMSFFEGVINHMATKSLRCVAFAYRPFDKIDVPNTNEELVQWTLPEDGFILIAIVGIKDPCRPGVRDAVTLCAESGVKVRMVTGDNIQTARAIAIECAILDPNASTSENIVIEGKTFSALSEGKREELVDKIIVMGRSSPYDKLLLMRALRKRGHVVAITGNGTYDSHALREADIGLSMGIAGTEVAKESSDIIILDDNFASIVKVVRWGRSVYVNIQKYIQFQFTVNMAALIINFIAAISTGCIPLNAVQLLWINLIMDTLGALALATERPTDKLMWRPPIGRREPLFTNVMWRDLIIQALYQVAIFLVFDFGSISFLLLNEGDAAHKQKLKHTLIFNAFVLCQLFNAFNARKPDELNVLKGVTRNRLFMIIITVTFLLQVVIIEFLGKFTSTVRLNWKLWLLSIAIGIFSWPLALIGKLMPVPKTPLLKMLRKLFKRRRPSCNA